MRPDDLKARARRIPQEILTQGDTAVIPEIFAAGFEQGGVTGATETLVSALRRAFPDLRAIVADEVAEDASIAQHLILTGTHRGPYLGIPPSGRCARWHVALILRDGPDHQFTRMDAIYDRLDLLCQLGGTAPEDDRS